MAENDGKPPSPEGNRLANSATVTHHSTMVVYLAAGLLTMLGVFGAGAFTAGVGLMATDFGQDFLREPFPNYVQLYLGAFAASFLLDVVAIMFLIKFCWDIVEDHRDALHNDTSFSGASSKTKGGYLAAVFVAFSVFALVFGVAYAIKIATAPAETSHTSSKNDEGALSSAPIEKLYDDKPSDRTTRRSTVQRDDKQYGRTDP